MSDRLSVGLIGCGGIGSYHAEGGYKQLWEANVGSFSLDAVCDVNASVAEKAAGEVEKWQGKRPQVYTDVERMLAGEKQMAAVDICTDHRSHHDVAGACLQAGKHVTIEKPLGITMRAAHAILRAQKPGLVLQVAENYRREPHERAINWAVKQGMIGKPRMLYWTDVGERLWLWGWRDDKSIAGGGWSMDGGVHFADLFRYHIGEIESLYSTAKTYAPVRYRDHENLAGPVPISVEDTTMAVLTFKNGVTGQWGSTSAAPGLGFSTRFIYGEEGSVSWREGLQNRRDTLPMPELVKLFMTSISDDEREAMFPRGIEESIATELNEFIEAVLHGGDLEIDGVEGLKDEAVCLALYESEYAGAPVSIEKVEKCEIEASQADLNAELGLSHVKPVPL